MSTHNWFSNPPAPLLAVEFQYFRAPRPAWERLLLRLRQMGANTVSTYVMWGWHEPLEGQFDFNGHGIPERDLVAFIQLAQDMGFWLILKPGPFIDAETLGGGIPSWLLAKIPEAHARRHDGTTWRHSDSNQPRLSYLHPQSLEYARRWLVAFSQVAGRFQWPQGGVIALQVDNETPGDGFIAGDQEDAAYDYHFRGDYNPHYTQLLWPQWLENRHASLENLSATYGKPVVSFNAIPFPGSWVEPTGNRDLRLWMDAARFTDWTFNQALRQYSGMLREQGWQVPFFLDLLCMPWEASGLLVNMGGLAAAAGWLGQNVYPEAVRTPIVNYNGFQMGFEEYVQHAFWRARLVKNYNPAFPSFVPEISSSGDFFLQSIFAGGTEAASIYTGVQSDPEPGAVGAYSRWAIEAPIRPDGSVRRRLWNTRTLYSYLQAGGRDFALSKSPADIILGYSHTPELAHQWFFWPQYFKSIEGRRGLDKMAPELNRALRGADSGARSQALAQELVRRQVDFDVLDVDYATPEQLNHEKLLVMPASSILSRRTQARLAEFLRRGGRMAWVSGELPEFDEMLIPCDELQRASQETGRVSLMSDLASQWQERLVQMGWLPRYAWSDAPEGVDATLRYGPGQTIYLSLVNRTNQTFDGNVYFLDHSRQIQSVNLRFSGPHVSFITLHAGRLHSGILYGQDGAHIAIAGERFAIDRGQVVITRHGMALAISSADPVKVEILRAGGWGNPVIWRILLDGRCLPARCAQISVETLAIDYPAEEAALETLFLLINPARRPVEAELRPFFDSHEAYARLMINKTTTHMLDLAGRLAAQPHVLGLGTSYQQAAAVLTDVSKDLQSSANALGQGSGQPLTVEGYVERIEQALKSVELLTRPLVDLLRHWRAALAAGQIPAENAWAERELATILKTLAYLE